MMLKNMSILRYIAKVSWKYFFSALKHVQSPHNQFTTNENALLCLDGGGDRVFSTRYKKEKYCITTALPSKKNTNQHKQAEFL